MNVTLALHRAPLPDSWSLPLAPPGFVATGLDWMPLERDGGPPATVRSVVVSAALRLGRLAYLGDPPSVGLLRWRSPDPLLKVADDPVAAESLFETAASFGQQGQAMAVFTRGAAPDATMLLQAAPARGGELAGLCETPSVQLVLLPALDGAALGVYVRAPSAAEWEDALSGCARNAGLPLHVQP